MDKVRMESSNDKLEAFVKACDLADKRIGIEMGLSAHELLQDADGEIPGG